MKSEGLTPAQLAERNAEYVTEISRLEKACAALAAENALARKAVQAFCDVVGDNTEGGRERWRSGYFGGHEGNRKYASHRCFPG